MSTFPSAPSIIDSLCAVAGTSGTCVVSSQEDVPDSELIAAAHFIAPTTPVVGTTSIPPLTQIDSMLTQSYYALAAVLPAPGSIDVGHDMHAPRTQDDMSDSEMLAAADIVSSRWVSKEESLSKDPALQQLAAWSTASAPSTSHSTSEKRNLSPDSVDVELREKKRVRVGST